MKKISTLIIMVVLFMLSAWNGHAATITVNSTADTTADDGLCTLREAIAAANTDTASGASVGECSAGSGDDTIDLTSLIGTITLAGTQLNLTTNIAITGPGAANLTISGGSTSRIFEISGTSTVAAISALTISNGSDTEGGGIRVADASLNLNDCTISNNVSTANASASGGGGLEVSAATAIANVTDCTFSLNTAVRGGAIHVNAGTLTVTDSTFDSNTANHASAAAYGGGIYNLGTSTVAGSTFKNNTAKTNSGGVYNSNSTGNTTLTNCTITGNQVTAGEGGGVRNNDGTLRLVNCTVTGNTATTQGGGIRRNGGTVNISNTIVANNTTSNCSGTITSGGYNIDSANTCSFTGTGDQINTNPQLGALQNNGGSTETYALLIAPTISPAIDAIPNGTNGCGDAGATDQRGAGYLRPETAGGACDIGSYEYQSSGAPEIDIQNPVGTSIADGIGVFDFGTTTVGTPVVTTFTIDNTAGTAVLTVGAVTAPAGYTVVTAPPATIAAGATATFQVQLDATGAGTYTGNELSLVTDDGDENPYNFELRGQVNPEIFSVSINVAPATPEEAWTLLTFTPAASGGTLASVTWKFGDCYVLPCAAGAVQSESTVTSAPFTETFRYPKPGTYVVTLEATDTLSNSATDIATIIVTGSAPGLTPTTSNLGDNLTAGSPVAGDLNGDGVKEVVVPSGDSIRVVGRVNMTLGPAAGTFGSAPLLAKNDTTGVINGIFALDTTGRLYGWNSSGGTLGGYPLTAAGITNVSLMASPAIGDIDGDGDLDFAWGGDNTSGSAYVTAHDIATGASLTGFPVLISNNVGTGATYPRTTSVALANVTGGAGREVFIGYNNVSTTTGNVMRVAAGGATLNFSMNTGEQIGSGGIPSTQYANSGPTVGDVNNDGVMELVLGGDHGNVYIWNASSAGPSPVLPEAVVSTGSAAPITSDPALAYLTSDTGLDIVAANSEGTVFYIRNGIVEKSTDLGTHGLLSPVIADVDGDNQLEVIISRMRSGRVFVLENDGSINTDISAATGTAGQINASAAVADLDRDADYEIIVTDDAVSPAEDRLYIWDIPKTLPTADLRTIVGWPFLRGNYHRDGSITTANLYPVNVTYNTSAWPLVKFWVHVENRGTGVANNVAVKYVSYQPFMSLVSPANGIVMVTPNPPDSIAAGTTGITEPYTFDMSAYAGQEIIMYFDITYTDADGTEHLIHR